MKHIHKTNIFDSHSRVTQLFFLLHCVTKCLHCVTYRDHKTLYFWIVTLLTEKLVRDVKKKEVLEYEINFNLDGSLEVFLNLIYLFSYRDGTSIDHQVCLRRVGDLFSDLCY